MGKRRICVWSGKRGGFGAMAPTMEAIQGHPNLELIVVVTDQHLYNRFGNTIEEVESRFPVTAAIDMGQAGDSNIDRGRAIGVCLTKAIDVLAELDPDVLLVIGDRGEVFAACIAAHNLRIPISHVQGGDVSGSLDEPIRHAITKLSHTHFPSTVAAAARLKGLGEEAWRIHAVGDTHVDQIVLGEATAEADLRDRFALPEEDPFLLVLQHSDSSIAEQSSEQMAETTAAVMETGLRTLMVFPCSDQGFEGIISEIERVADGKTITAHRNIPAPDFIGLQKISAALIGNSSAGLIEAPYFGLPAINIGNRQLGRERASNVIDVAYDRKAIAAAVKIALHNESFLKKIADEEPPFGDGKAYERIVKVLADLTIDAKLLDKRMTY
jgi:UDP-N-acetylglucosamine 2-epimerase (non-hydrolysing)/GDP/UDP-N,N'-diacetylbacillosamine 2-epimerase (hydrolysing)